MSKVTKKQLQEDIKSLESGIAMNWSDMKKIEVRLSRAMTDMATRISNISLQLEGQQRQIHLPADSIGLNKQAIIMLENEREAEAEPEPQLKQLDQSVFDGLDEKWRFAAVDGCTGRAYVYEQKPHIMHIKRQYWRIDGGLQHIVGDNYDTSNWQNSLIERDIAKELLEVDLSSELTGSDLARAMLARGDKYISGFGHHHSDALALQSKFADTVSKHTQCFQSSQNAWDYFVPINNQGEPLTAAEAGL